MNADDLRPKGTVPVYCAKCSMSWFVDPLDPNLPDGPPGGWDCGSNHERDQLERLYFSWYRVTTGYQWVATSGLDQNVRVARFQDRFGHGRGLLSWTNQKDLETGIQRIQWLKPEDLSTPMDLEPPKPPEGMVRTVNYRLNGKEIRSYTFGKCKRPGCQHEVMLDYQDPSRTRKPNDTIEVGKFGGGFEVAPEWDLNGFTCEQALGTFSRIPCAIAHGTAFRELAGDQICWSIWDQVTDTTGVILFWTTVGHGSQEFGILVYKKLNQLSSAAVIKSLIEWKPLGSLLHFVKNDPIAKDSSVRMALEDLMVFYGTV